MCLRDRADMDHEAVRASAGPRHLPHRPHEPGTPAHTKYAIASLAQPCGAYVVNLAYMDTPRQRGAAYIVHYCSEGSGLAAPPRRLRWRAMRQLRGRLPDPPQHFLQDEKQNSFILCCGAGGSLLALGRLSVAEQFLAFKPPVTGGAGGSLEARAGSKGRGRSNGRRQAGRGCGRAGGARGVCGVALPGPPAAPGWAEVRPAHLRAGHVVPAAARLPAPVHPHKVFLICK